MSTAKKSDSTPNRAKVTPTLKRHVETSAQQNVRDDTSKEPDEVSRVDVLFRPRDLFGMSPLPLMRRFADELLRVFSSAGCIEIDIWSPRIEVRRQNNVLVLSAELTGVNKSDLKVEVTRKGLVIQGERKREKGARGKGLQRADRLYGRFCRLIPLPKGAKVDDAKAQFKNGVLEVFVPLPGTQQKHHEIPILSSGKNG